ncbi:MULTISPECIES: sensor histidine kinase [Planktothricoides]|uniref:histidine kinase n=1 Tax=Planktothricoides raciborskii FACHB-1370 TaxID=2949576 RepID=A0ABR8ED56_9CYAN|nr:MULTISPECIES: ATP-binding protein [Planktothricoides]KOR34585.1 histidine kinase [Planktothricoides sp. SR001]MBD2544430.1 HAMP domain-containing protein [Planktothricoides raciborskii FACHB-1370]MBD2585523.1 HAMP domain-containing protein [Planktothricoides raciborskii FACHB-1261]
MKPRRPIAGLLKIPVAVKLFLPLSVLFIIFLGLWTTGTYLFFRKFFEQNLRRETEAFTSVLLSNIEQRQNLLQSKAKWLADGNNISPAIASNNSGMLFQELLPIQYGLKLDLIQVIANDSLLADLRQPILQNIPLQDQKVTQAAKAGLQLSDVIATEGDAPSVLISLISLKNSEKVVGSIIVGFAFTEQILNEIRGDTPIHLVVFQGSQIKTATLPIYDPNWQPPSPNSPTTYTQIAGQGYIVKTVTLGSISDDLKVVMLNPTAPLEEAENRLFYTIKIMALIGGAIALCLCFYFSRWLNRRIRILTNAMQQFAAGNLSIHINIDSPDEIGILAEGFNAMAEQLTQRDRQIQHQLEELNQTLKKLQETQAYLVQSEKMSSLGQMIAGIAHEINNPVNFIHGNLTYVKQYTDDLLQVINLYETECPDISPEMQEEIAEIELDYLKDDLPKILQSMRGGTDRIRAIVLSLRNFSRLDESDLKAVNIHEGIDSTLLILQSRLHENSQRPEIAIIKEYGELPLVECYAGQLNQVFMNILANGIDALDKLSSERSFAENQGDPLWIKISTEVLPENWVNIKILDNGIGIPEELRSRIFDPFFTTKDVGKGTGLGLSISYQIVVEKHGGKLFCESSSDRGISFVISLPIKHN